MEEMACDWCGKRMACYSEVGYDAPRDQSERCNPFIADWLTLCIACNDARNTSPPAQERA